MTVEDKLHRLQRAVAAQAPVADAGSTGSVEGAPRPAYGPSGGMYPISMDGRSLYEIYGQISAALRTYRSQIYPLLLAQERSRLEAVKTLTKMHEETRDA